MERNVTRIHDKDLGVLTYTDFWERSETIEMFGKPYSVTLVFVGEPDEGIAESQRRAFASFDQDRSEILRRAELSLLDYYQRIDPEMRVGLETGAHGVAPLVSSVNELGGVLTPTEITFPDRPGQGRVVGLLFDCTWDPELGVGVKLVDERVAQVGTQDIVL